MGTGNLERMIALAEEFFAAKNDPHQISIDESTIARLHQIHADTMSERKDENGPIAWLIITPTTHGMMEKFVAGEADEQDILDLTPLGIKYDALYLCSVLVLPEYRGKGVARELLACAIRSICDEHPIRSLFYWAFSPEGESLASAVAREFSLPLIARKD
jgi:GNAT superfamily N-acetyltransferase